MKKISVILLFTRVIVFFFSSVYEFFSNASGRSVGGRRSNRPVCPNYPSGSALKRGARSRDSTTVMGGKIDFSTSIFMPLVILLLMNLSCAEKKEPAGSAEEIETSDGLEPDSVAETHQNGFFNELDDPERDEWQMPELVIEQFGSISDKVIADIGAGTGYFSFRIASKGADVLAIDIDSNFLEHIEEVALEMTPALEGQIRTRIAPPGSPSLMEKEVDGALIVNTVSFLPERENYFKEIRQGLKNGGKIVIVDFKAEPSPVRPSENLLISSEKLVSELKTAGFRQVNVNTTSLPYQYIISAVKP